MLFFPPQFWQKLEDWSGRPQIMVERWWLLIVDWWLIKKFANDWKNIHIGMPLMVWSRQEGVKQSRRYIEKYQWYQRETEKRKVWIWKTGNIATRHTTFYKFNPSASQRMPAMATVSASGVEVWKVWTTWEALDLETWIRIIFTAIPPLQLKMCYSQQEQNFQCYCCWRNNSGGMDEWWVVGKL